MSGQNSRSLILGVTSLISDSKSPIRDVESTICDVESTIRKRIMDEAGVVRSTLALVPGGRQLGRGALEKRIGPFLDRGVWLGKGGGPSVADRRLVVGGSGDAGGVSRWEWCRTGGL